jgi:alpha-beta hydrolase superfamily lysophospholipase
VTATAADLAGREAAVIEHAPRGPVQAVALVLPGGKAHSFDPTDTSQLTALRMRPFVRALARRGAAHGVAVWLLRYRCRGWNGAEQCPVIDTRWALDEVRRRYGDVPVVLVGHSMGGRAALAAGGDPSVVGVCALAPWCEKADPVNHLAGRTIFIAHGTRDRVTSPRASWRFAVRAAGAGATVGYLAIHGEHHGMVVRWRRWHRLAVGFTMGRLGRAPMPEWIQQALDRGVES